MPVHKIDVSVGVYVLVMAHILLSAAAQGGGWPMSWPNRSRNVVRFKDLDEEQLWRHVTCIVTRWPNRSQNNGSLESISTDCTLSVNEDAQYSSPYSWTTLQIQNKTGSNLLCQDERSVTIVFDAAEASDTYFYLLDVSESATSYLSIERATVIADLRPASNYSIRTAIMMVNSSAFRTDDFEVQTLASGYVPRALENATNSNYTVNEHKLLDVDIKWTNTEGMCLYEIVLHSPQVGHEFYMKEVDLRDGTARQSGNYLSISIRNLSYGLEYEAWICAINTVDRSLEGPKFEFDFKTPSPSHFNMSDKDDPYYKSITRNLYESKAQFNWRKLRESFYELSPLIAILVIVVMVIFYYYYQKKTRHARSRISEDDPNYIDDLIPMDTLNSIYLTDQTQISMQNIRMQGVIGRGAFGLVRKAIIKVGDREQLVAVKMLRKCPNADDIKEFRHEIDVMKAVGKHPNIVSLIGHSTNQPDMMILIEYCSRGNLLHVLREEWKRLRNISDAMMEESQGPDRGQDIVNAIENKCYSDMGHFTNKALLSIACQIATGMEYLAINKVVHRDVAARNILVCDDDVVKIADFGLSRDVYQENMYKRRGSGKLPIKWLAIESLTHQIYTTQSDVWSYGILLYEILTLGSTPYPSVQTNELLRLLNKGYRMEKPRNCSDEIYELMNSCWQTNPKDRPSFTQIIIHIGTLEATTCADTMILLEEDSLPECNGDRRTNEHSYLTPI